jgi:hypothetical protein
MHDSLKSKYFDDPWSLAPIERMLAGGWMCTFCRYSLDFFFFFQRCRFLMYLIVFTMKISLVWLCYSEVICSPWFVDTVGNKRCGHIICSCWDIGVWIFVSLKKSVLCSEKKKSCWREYHFWGLAGRILDFRNLRPSVPTSMSIEGTQTLKNYFFMKLKKSIFFWPPLTLPLTQISNNSKNKELGWFLL